MSPAAKSGPRSPTRRYRSTVRAQAASDTRRSILDTAMRLFLERGYGMVTVADIAAEASLALATVYASTGGKAAIFSILIDEVMRDPIVGETFSALREGKTGPEVMAAAANGIRIDIERYHDIVQVMKNAAASDEAAAEILRRYDDGYRGVMRRIARRLRTVKALGGTMSETRAADILFFHFGWGAWHVLVAECGWSWDDAEQWLLTQASSAMEIH